MDDKTTESPIILYALFYFRMSVCLSVCLSTTVLSAP